MRSIRSSFLVVRLLLVATGVHAGAGRREAAAASSAAASGACGSGTANLPLWAYGYAQPAPRRRRRCRAAPDDGSLKTLQGSTGKFTLTQIRDGFGPADWHPGDHPAMPEIVARGRKDGNVRACALCHYPNGKGRAENAPVSGLPVSYFVQQMVDYRAGTRKSADPKKGNTNAMIAIAKGDDRRRDSCGGAVFRIDEVDAVDQGRRKRTRCRRRASPADCSSACPGSETEPLGMRIIEMPEDNAREALRDPRVGIRRLRAGRRASRKARRS